MNLLTGVGSEMLTRLQIIHLYRSANAYKDCGLTGWTEKADYVECIRAMAEVRCNRYKYKCNKYKFKNNILCGLHKSDG